MNAPGGRKPREDAFKPMSPQTRRSRPVEGFA